MLTLFNRYEKSNVDNERKTNGHLSVINIIY